MTKFLYVLVVILSALVTVWCSFSWTLCLAVFLGFTLLLLLLLLLFQRQGEEVRARHETNWFADIYNFTLLRTKLHKENNSIVDTVDNNSYKDHRYLKGISSVNSSRDRDQTESEDEDEEDIPASGSRLVTIMSDLEKSLTNNRFMSSLLSMFNRGSNTENDRPFSPPGRHNNKERKTGRNNRRRFTVGVDDADDGATSHMSPSSSFRISTSPRIVGSPRGRINTGYYESSRTPVSRRSDDNLSSFSMSTRPQTRRFAKSPGTPSSSSSLTTSPLPRFHRTACESPDRPGINPVGFTPHALQRPGVCYPSNSSPGVLPRVCLEKRIKIPLIETNVNKMSPVTVRIAPPEMGTNHSPKFTSSKQNPNNFSLPPDTNDVLSALREGTRKRTNVCSNDEDSIFESANTTAKRRRQESNHSTASSSSMPSLPDFLPDLSLCNFTQSSYMSPTSRYTIPSSAAVSSSSSATVTLSSPNQVASGGVNSGVKRPVAPCAHLSPSENSPNSKRPRQEVKNNPILSSLSSSQRYRLHRKDPVKRKFLDSPELQDSNTSKENSKTNSNDNQQSEKPTSKLSRFIAESTKHDTETNSTSVSIATPDHQSEETQVSTNANESKTTPDLRSRRKHLSFATPTIDLDRLSYANVYATKQDYENDRKAEQERVEKMLDRIATEKTTSDADLLSEKNIVGSSEETSVLTIPSTTLSSTSSTLTSTTTTTSLIVSSTATTTTTTSSSSITRILLAPTTTSSESPSSTLAVSTASATPTTTKASLPSASPLSSLLQVTSPSSSTSTSTLTTTSSATSTATLVPQTTTQATTGFFSSVTKPTETSTSLSSTSIPSATTPGQPFKPMFGSLAPTSTTTSNSLSLGGVQFASVPLSSSSSSPSSIPSTATSGFSFGTFTAAGSTSTTPATTTTSSFAFGTNATNTQTSAITTATTQTNAGPSMFSSPSKDVSKPGGFSFSPQVTPTSAATQKSGSQSAASPFSTPNTSVPPATSSSLFSFTSTSAQSFTTASTTASLSFGTATVTLPTVATSTTPAPGGFVFTKSSTPSSLPQSSTTIPTTGMFPFKPSDTAAKTSTGTIPTTKSTSGTFTFKADSASTVTTASNQNFSFGGSGTNVNTPAFSTSSTSSAVFGATTATNTFGSASSTFGATLATSAPKFGATSTNESAFSATSKALPPAFGTAIKPAFGATSSVSTPVFGANPVSTTPAFASQSSATSPLFSSTDKSKPTFGVTSSPFGTSSTAASTPFGASSAAASSPFGASSTAASSPFGASSTVASTPFGTSSTVASTPFGTSSTVASTPFGTSSTVASTPFGTSTAVSTPFGTSTAASSTPFGTSTAASSTPFGTSTTASTAFGTSSTTFGASSNPSTLFGASAGQSNQTNLNKSGTFTFGGSANTAQQTSTTSAPMAGFNFTFNSSTPSQKTFAFGGGGTSSSKAATSTTATVTSVAPSAVAGSTSIFGQASNAFGGFSSAGQDGQKPMFGSPSTNTSGFNFSGTSANQTTNVFGQTGQPSQNSDQSANQPFTFGQGSTPGNTSMPFGQSSAFSSPQASSFGSFGAKPTNVFSTPTNNSDKTSQPTPNIFGSTTTATSPNLTAQSKPLFGQVASQPFGTASGTPSTTGNTGLFGTTATGQVTTPAAGSPAPGIFTFGQSPGTPLQTAAATTNPNQGFDFSASLGGTSQFNFGQGGTPSKSTMFNMGSGNTTPKMRSSFPKARRRGAKK